MTAGLPDLEYKTAVVPDEARTGALGAAFGGIERKDANPSLDLSGDPDGTVWAIVAVTGIKDDVNDIIVPGAFRRSLKEREMKGVLGHDWNRPVAVQREAVELMPADPRLPTTLADGQTPWPREAGALLVKASYILGTSDGRDAWEHAKAYGPTHCYSIGYKVAKAREKGGVRYIYDLDVYEFSPVLHGANRLARLQAVKSVTPDDIEHAEQWLALPEGKARSLVRRVVDSAYWGRPVGTIITPGMKPVGPRHRAGARDRGGAQRAGQRGVTGGMGAAGTGGLRRDTAAAVRAREASRRDDSQSINWRKSDRIGELARQAVRENRPDVLRKLVDEHGKATVVAGTQYGEHRSEMAEALERIEDERDAELGAQREEGETREKARARATNVGNVGKARTNLRKAITDEEAKRYDADRNKLNNLRAMVRDDRPLVASDDGRVAALHRGTDDKGKDKGWAVLDTRTGEILASGESDDDVQEFVESAAEVAEEREKRDARSAGRDGGEALEDAPGGGVRGDSDRAAGGAVRGAGGAGAPGDRGAGGGAGRTGPAGGDVPGEGGATDRGAAQRRGAGAAGADSGDADGGDTDAERGGAGVGRGGGRVQRRSDGSGTGEGGDAVTDPDSDAGLAPDDVDESDLPEPDLQVAGRLDKITGDDFQPQSIDDLAPAGARAKLNANMAALRMLRNLQRDPQGRSATPAEQAVLARWAGWGGLPKVFDDDYPEYAAEREELRGLLSQQEWNAARKNTLNAHYTDPRAVEAMWEAMREFGFSGGRLLEPGSGSGNFIGFAPDNADMVGVELDPTTAALSKYLYPGSEIRNESFGKTRLPKGSFDGAVGNVPFGKFPIHDPSSAGNGMTIHNHFIIKSLELTRPGGMVNLLTSRYTLDAMDSKAREEMAKLGDLVAAVRLPSGSHQRASGTDVIEDILIFRRRADGEPPQTDQSWVNSAKVDASEALGGDEKSSKVTLNPYWERNPGHVLGETEIVRGQFGADIRVRGDRNMGGLRGVLSGIADDARERGLTMTERTEELPALIAADSSRHEGHIAVDADGGFSQASGGAAAPLAVPKSATAEVTELLGMRDALSRLLTLESQQREDTDEIAAARADLNRRYDAYVARYGPVNRYKIAANGARQIDTAQRWFRRDPMSAIVRALEIYDANGNGGKGSAVKADVFHKRSAAPRELATTADTPADALALSMETYGEVRLGEIARMLGVDEPEARVQLGDLVQEVPALSFAEEEAAVEWARAVESGVLDSPELPPSLAGVGEAAATRGELIPRAEYTSGDVRRKLAQARLMARFDPRFERNVAALEAVVPTDLAPGEMDGRLGAAWIPVEVVEQFVNELMETNSDYNPRSRIKVSKAGTNWEVDGGNSGTLAEEVWGTERRPFGKLLQGMLEQRPIRITTKIDGKTVQDMEATLAAQAKAEELHGRFSEWLWEDPDRSRAMASNYNWQFNSIALRSYAPEVDADGNLLRKREFPGMAAHFEPRPHQIGAVERMINEPTALLGHVVGAGKTAEMVIGTQELKRLGLARKPAIVVPNHMLEQFTREYLEVYPNAKILAAGSDDLAVTRKDGVIVKDGRREFTARAATGDWDAVILTQNAFEKIPMSLEQQKEYVDRELGEMRAQLEAAKAADPDGQKRSTKQMEQSVASAEAKMDELLAKGEKDEGGVTFEQTGIDYLMVDEAHHYSNLRTVTRIPNAGASGSGKATDLHMKMDYLRANTQTGRVATFATGTPIRNTVTQSYIMQKFLRPDLLRASGIEAFDDWAATFGETVEKTELKPEGEGYRQTTRFAKFRNVPELLQQFHTFSDIKMADDLKLPTPNLAGGRPQNVVVPSPEGLKEYIAWLAERGEDVRNGDVEPDQDNMLSISMDGRKAALSMALVRRPHDRTSAAERANAPTFPHTPGKLEVAADRIHGIYEKTKDRRYPKDPKDPSQGMDPNPGAMQIVFLDLGTPQSEADKKKAEKNAEDPRFDAYNHLRDELVARGMDRSRIRFMHEAKNDEEKARLFAMARSGAIDVLVGSTEKMGVGTNVQKRAVALHHLDAPWRPADVEQRDGRIMRQGNLNPDVEILRYVTEESFDTYMWQTLERKAKFINQIMRGKLDSREVDDVGDTEMSYAELKALASGNPDLLTKSNVDILRVKLERLKRTHERTQANMREDIGKFTVEADASEASAEKLEAAAAVRRDTRGDKFHFALTLQGAEPAEFRDRAAAVEALKPHLENLRYELRRRYSGPKWEAIGAIGGHTLVAEYRDDRKRGPVLVLRLDGVPGDITTLTNDEIAAVGPGLITRVENFLDGMAARGAMLRDHAEGRRAEIERMSARVGMTFGKDRELFAAQAKSRRLQEKMERDARRKTRGLTPEQVRELPGDDIDAYDPLIDTAVNDDPILGRDEAEVLPADLPEQAPPAAAPTVETEPAVESPREITSPAGEVADETPAPRVGLSAGQLDAARADADAAVTEGSVPNLAGALERMGVPDEDGRDALARALIALPEDVQRRRLDQIEEANAAEDQQAGVLAIQRQRVVDAVPREVEEQAEAQAEEAPEPAASGERVPSFGSIQQLSRYIAGKGEGASPGQVSSYLRGIIRSERQELGAEQQRWALAAIAGQGRNSRDPYGLERARLAMQRLADGDVTLPANAMGQRIVGEETDPNDTTIRIRNGRAEPMRTRPVSGRVVEIERLYSGSTVRLIIDRDGGPDERGAPRAVIDMPADGTLTLVDPEPTATISAEDVAAAETIDAPDTEPGVAPNPPDEAPTVDYIAEALATVPAAYADSDEGRASHLYNEMERAKQNFDYDRALALGGESLRLDPRRARWWTDLAAVLTERRDDGNARAAAFAANPIAAPDRSELTGAAIRGHGIRPGDRVAVWADGAVRTGTADGTPGTLWLRADDGRDRWLGGAQTVIEAARLDADGRVAASAGVGEAGRHPTPESSRARTNRINAAVSKVSDPGWGGSRRVLNGSVHTVPVPVADTERVVDAIRGLGWAGMIVRPGKLVTILGGEPERRVIEVRVPDTGPDGLPLRTFDDDAPTEAPTPVRRQFGKPVRVRKPSLFGGAGEYPTLPADQLRPGDQVYLETFDQFGEIVEISAGDGTTRWLTLNDGEGNQVRRTVAERRLVPVLNADRGDAETALQRATRDREPAPAPTVPQGPAGPGGVPRERMDLMYRTLLRDTGTVRGTVQDAEQFTVDELRALADELDNDRRSKFRQAARSIRRFSSDRARLERLRAPESTPEPAAVTGQEIPDTDPGTMTARELSDERTVLALQAIELYKNTGPHPDGESVDSVLGRIASELAARIETLRREAEARKTGGGYAPLTGAARVAAQIRDLNDPPDRPESMAWSGYSPDDYAGVSRGLRRLAAAHGGDDMQLELAAAGIDWAARDRSRKEGRYDKDAADYVAEWGADHGRARADAWELAADLLDEFGIARNSSTYVRRGDGRRDFEVQGNPIQQQLRDRAAAYRAAVAAGSDEPAALEPEPDRFRPETANEHAAAIYQALNVDGSERATELIRAAQAAHPDEAQRWATFMRQARGLPAVPTGTPLDANGDVIEEPATISPEDLAAADELVSMPETPVDWAADEPPLPPPPAEDAADLANFRLNQPASPAGREPYQDKPGAVRVHLDEDQRPLAIMKFEDLLTGEQDHDDQQGAYMSPDMTALLVHDKPAALAEVDNALEILDENLDPPGGFRPSPEDRRRYQTEQRKWQQIHRRIKASPDPVPVSADEQDAELARHRQVLAEPTAGGSPNLGDRRDAQRRIEAIESARGAAPEPESEPELPGRDEVLARTRERLATPPDPRYDVAPEPEPAAAPEPVAEAPAGEPVVSLPLDGPQTALVSGKAPGALVGDDGRSLDVSDPDALREWLDEREQAHSERGGDKRMRRAAARLRGALDDALADRDDDQGEPAEPEPEQTAADMPADIPAEDEIDQSQDLFADAETPAEEEAPAAEEEGEDAAPDMAALDDGGVPADDVTEGDEPLPGADESVEDVPVGAEPAAEGLADQAPADAPTGAPEQARLSAEMVEEAQQVEADALGLIEAEDGEWEVTPDVAARQTRVERRLRERKAGKLAVAKLKDSELTEGRRDTVDELRLQEAIARRERDRRRERDQERRAEQAAAEQAAAALAPEGEPIDGEEGAEAPAPAPVPMPEPEPAVKLRPGLAGAVEDLADAIDAGDPDAIDAAKRRAWTSLRRSRGDSQQHRELMAELAPDEAMGESIDPARLRELAAALRENARAARNDAAKRRRLVKRLERERLRALLGEYDAELRNRGRNPDDYGGTAPPAVEEMSAGDVSRPEDPGNSGNGPGATPGAAGAEATAGPGSVPGPENSVAAPVVSPPSPTFDRADPDGPAGQARTTALVDALLSQPWRMLGAGVVNSADDPEQEGRRAAARAAVAPVLDQFGPMVRRRSNQDHDEAARQARAKIRRTPRGQDVDAAAAAFGLLLPEAQHPAFVAAMRKAFADFKKLRGGRGAGQRESRTEGD